MYTVVLISQIVSIEIKMSLVLILAINLSEKITILYK